MDNKVQKRPAIFLDRDGVLNFDYGYVGDPYRITLLEGVPEALLELQLRGYFLVVVSNQSGVARGYFDEAAVLTCNQTLAGQIINAGGPDLDLVLYCPHHPDASVAQYKKKCDCRKPAPGLILMAAKQLPIDLSRSFMIGDKPEDVECGIRAGVKGIQIAHEGRLGHPQALGVVHSLMNTLPLIPRIH